ncbi:MAG: hypothetical protein GY778_24220 [bacterium]|nr:hypothetical protein [bacterium]
MKRAPASADSGRSPMKPDGKPGRRAISRHRAVNLLHARVVEIVTGCYLLYVLLGTLIPFDFELSSAFGADRAWLGLGTDPSGLPDLFSNIGLYVPLGLLFFWTLSRTLGMVKLAVLAAVAVAAVISLAVESIQLLSPTRVSSLMDFTANLVGAGTGAVLAYVCRWPERGLLTGLRGELLRNTPVTVAKIWAGLIIVGGLSPYTPTFDVTRLVESVGASSVVPYGQAHDLAAQARAAAVQGRNEDAAGFQRDRMHLWARWSVACLSFGVFGYLLSRALVVTFGFKQPWVLLLVVYLSGALAVLLGAMQLVILSRGWHLTDVCMRLYGAVGGGLWAAWTARQPTAERGMWRCGGLGIGRMSQAVLALAVVLVLFTGLCPFRLDVGTESVAAKMSSKDVLPFYSYYLGRFDRVCADFWGKTLCYGFLGVALWGICKTRQGSTRAASPLGIVGISLAVATAIEVAQLGLISRVPCLTDLILAGVAATVGAICAQYALDFYRHAIGARAAVAPESAGMPHAASTWSPSDALVATLIPDPDSVPEPLPHRAPPSS